MTILYVLLALVLLGVLITVHEFGHFIFSKLKWPLLFIENFVVFDEITKRAVFAR